MTKSAKLLCAALVVLLLAIPLAGCSKPLTLSLTSPRDGRAFSQSPIEVRASVSDVKATVWVNDTVVPVTKYRSGGGYISIKLELEEGENFIKVTAARGKPDKWKDIVERSATVTYTP